MDKNDLKFQGLEKISLLLGSLEMAEPKKELFLSILNAINRRKRFARRLKLGSLSLTTTFFIVYAVSVWNIVITEIQQSATIRLLSLFFSDSGAVLANWKYFAFYFLESLPIVPILLFLLGVFLALIIFKVLTQELSHRTNSRVMVSR